MGESGIDRTDNGSPNIVRAIAQALIDGAHNEAADDRAATEALSGLRQMTGALAAGFWKRTGNHLVLRAFNAGDDMPGDVQSAFRAATANVSLDQTALAIVQAVLAGKTVTAVPPPEGETGAGSPAWLRRFAARQSAAVPVVVDGSVVAAIAVASTRLFRPEEVAAIEAVAEAIARAWRAKRPS